MPATRKRARYINDDVFASPLSSAALRPALGARFGDNSPSGTWQVAAASAGVAGGGDDRDAGCAHACGQYRAGLVLRRMAEGVGHHGMWFKNKPQIRPTLTNGKPGKIPDGLIAGKGSRGIEWFIVELKSPQDKLFNKSGGFSSVANLGLAQLAQYLVYSNEKQGFIRDALEIKQFKTPQGIFVIGNEIETENNEKFKELKAFWNANLHNIKIVSYSMLLRNAKNL